MKNERLATGSAESPGAGTIVNAMATGKGAAFAIDLKVMAKVIINNEGGIRARIEGDRAEDTTLIELCVKTMLDEQEEEYGATVITKSELPVARGLSSSSAASNAVVMATASALEKLGHARKSDRKLMDIGIDASLRCGVSITGAFDDASASFFGGAVVTDNECREILRKMEMPDLETALLIPAEKSYSGKADVETMKLLAPQVEMAHKEAREGDILNALVMNGLIYCASIGLDPKPAILALRAGALAAGLSGKGPAFVALTEDGEAVRDAWKTFGGDVIITSTENYGSRVLE